MKWMKMKTYLAPSFMKEIDFVSNIYLSLIKEIHEENSYDKNNKYSELRESIIRRIDEIDKFYELNFDQPYISHFERGRIKLKKLLMYEPHLFNQQDTEQEEKDTSYLNEEVRTKVNEKDSSHVNVNFDSKRQTPLKASQLKTPVAAKCERVKATEDNAIRSQPMNNIYKSAKSKPPPSKGGQSSASKNRKENSEITLQQNNESIQYNQANNNEECSENRHHIQETPIQMSMRTNTPIDQKGNQKNEWDYDEDNNYQEGDVIERNNFEVYSQSNQHSNSKLKERQGDIMNKPKDIKSQTRNNNRSDNQSDKHQFKATKQSEEQSNTQEQPQTTERETKELMIQFQLTEEEYSHLLEVKSKMIMKSLEITTKKKKN